MYQQLITTSSPPELQGGGPVKQEESEPIKQIRGQFTVPIEEEENNSRNIYKSDEDDSDSEPQSEGEKNLMAEKNRERKLLQLHVKRFVGSIEMNGEKEKKKRKTSSSPQKVSWLVVVK